MKNKLKEKLKITLIQKKVKKITKAQEKKDNGALSNKGYRQIGKMFIDELKYTINSMPNTSDGLKGIVNKLNKNDCKLEKKVDKDKIILDINFNDEKLRRESLLYDDGYEQCRTGE